MKLGHKLLFAPILTGVVAVAAISLNVWMGDRNAKAVHDAYSQGLAHVQNISKASDQMGQLHASVYRTITLIGSLDDAHISGFRKDLAPRLNDIQRTMQASGQTEDRVDKLLATYKSQADTAVDLSSVDPNTGIAALQNADATFMELAAAYGHLTTQISDQASVVANAAKVRSRWQALWISVLALVMVAGAIGSALWVQRKVVTDLGRASLLAREVAHGNLALDLGAEHRSDELGALMQSLVGMQAQLRTLVGSVRTSAKSIEVASSEVAVGNTDLSQRTEQAASSLQQTASSMERLTSTVQQSTEAAHTANQLAASAASVAQRGGLVVAQVVSTMDDINTSSKRIADITGTIDSIAFQTNILALNAAVEAARAGEQGRGFAVVAGEVRGLARRSSEAAKEIKSLIGASVSKVESGARLVADAGSTMNEIVASVQLVTDIMGEISTAAGEQSQGIGRVNVAVTHLDQMTQQNAALVEQSAAAAESLREQAHKLTKVVSTFKLDLTDLSENASKVQEPKLAQSQPTVATKIPSTPFVGDWETF